MKKRINRSFFITVVVIFFGLANHSNSEEMDEKTVASESQPKPTPKIERKKTIFEGGTCTLNSGNALALLGVFIGYLDCIFPE